MPARRPACAGAPTAALDPAPPATSVGPPANRRAPAVDTARPVRGPTGSPRRSLGRAARGVQVPSGRGPRRQAERPASAAGPLRCPMPVGSLTAPSLLDEGVETSGRAEERSRCALCLRPRTAVAAARWDRSTSARREGASSKLRNFSGSRAVQGAARGGSCRALPARSQPTRMPTDCDFWADAADPKNRAAPKVNTPPSAPTSQ